MPTGHGAEKIANQVQRLARGISPLDPPSARFTASPTPSRVMPKTVPASSNVRAYGLPVHTRRSDRSAFAGGQSCQEYRQVNPGIRIGRLSMIGHGIEEGTVFMLRKRPRG